ncbi:SusC/RagA family TonB-linked outer membrane protein [Puteibacter caeruleilacunae]|nr:SusC/RagA family TonB-linked outer membrane protein [Puteibacter caeruleilacunae]
MKKTLRTKILSFFQGIGLKFVLIMKLTLFLLCLNVFVVSASSYSQVAKFTLKGENVELEEVLQKIKQSSEFSFFYNHELVDVKKAVNYNVRNATINELLNQVLKDTDLKYEIVDRTIVIAPDKSAKAVAPVPAQKKTIKGKVTDEEGEPLPGASVVVKGTTIGITSDFDGNYELEIPEGVKVIVVSFVGMKPQEIEIAGQTTINVVLESDAFGLEEVVAVGYGSMKKINMSGAVGTVSTKVLENRPIRNISEGLQGAIANLNVDLSNGRSSSVPNINIRGFESINGGSPLIIIDGISSSESDLARLNPNDVESMSVLKDAASCAIYGARASFGVLLIKTKTGDGKLSVTYNGGMSFRSPTVLPDMVTDPYQVMVAKETAAYPYYSDLYPDEHVEYAKLVSEGKAPAWRMSPGDSRYWQHFASTDWFDEVYRDYGVSQDHNFAISGREKKTSYYFSGAMFDEDGIFEHGNDKFQRYNVRSKLNFEITDWLKVGNNTSWENTSYNEPAHQSHWLMFHNINRTSPTSPIYNPDGSYTSEGAYMIGGAESIRAKTKNSIIMTQLTAELQLVKDIWKVNGDYTVKKTNWNKDSYSIPVPFKTGPEEATQYKYPSSSVWKGNSTTVYKGINIYTSINKTFEKHALSGVFGFNQEESIYDQFEASKKDLISSELPTLELATGDATNEATYRDWAVRGVFGRINYIFDEKYIVEANGRYDGSSRFPSDDRFGFFPSFSVAWRLDRERFMPELSWLSSLKPRASWGTLGNQSVSNYAYIASMSSGKISQILGGNQPIAVYKPGLVAGDLTWETVESLNVGVDVGLFDNKLNATLDIYERITKDMLTKSKSLPGVLGTSEPKENAADLKNRGWELTINWKDQFDVAGSPLNYSVGFNISDSRSWITKFDNPDAYLDDYYVGEEIGDIWGLQSLDLYQSADEVLNHAYEDHLASDEVRYKAVGDVQWKDLDGDGKITNGAWRYGNTGDYSIIGNNQSHYRYGINISADWKNFDLRIFGQGVGKRDYYPGSGNHYFWGILAQPWAQVSEHIVNNVWTPERTDAYFPRLKAYAAEDSWSELGIPQTRYLINAAYFRLKNVTLGYTLPKSWMSKLTLSKVRFYVSAENILTISDVTKYGMDPEVLSGSGDYPMQKKISFGINVMF